MENPLARRLMLVLSDPHVVELWMGLARCSAIIDQANAFYPDLVILDGDYYGYNLSHDRLVMPAEIAKTAGELKTPP